jgi:hypothetical protein
MAKLDHNTWDIDDLIENLINLLSAPSCVDFPRSQRSGGQHHRRRARHGDDPRMGEASGLAERIELIEQGS